MVNFYPIFHLKIQKNCPITFFFCAYIFIIDKKNVTLHRKTRQIMKLTKDLQLNPEDAMTFMSAYRYLANHTRDRISVSEWLLVRQYINKGIEAGIYGYDAHGVHQLVHLTATCQVLHQQVGLGRRSMLTVLLYPLAEHDVISREEVVHDFGEEVAHLMSCMGKVKHLYAEHDSLEDENFRKLLLSFAQDIRVIICLICDRYTLLKALNHNPDLEYRSKVTAECRLLYTPLAHRLGLYVIKGEMEDMAVKYDHREVYDDIAMQLQDTKDAREAYIHEFITPLEAKLKETLSVPFHIKGRTKSIASIWNKLKKQQKRVDQIYDLFAIRIIIDEADLKQEKARCWQAYSVVTDMYQPNPKRLKDWLSIPKSNGYESLHITVYGPKERWVEVQIRTKRMDDIAERGLAAHWKYKGLKSQGSADDVMSAIREVLEAGTATGELMKDFSMGLYEEEVFVFTPNGDVHKLPKGATVLDFAFGIHTRLGMQCVGARVSGKNVKLNYQLKSGETVEILTSNQQTPKQDWLNIVKTGKARSRIRQGLKEIESHEAQMAKEMLQRRFKNRKIEIDESEMSRLIIKLGFKTQTQFYHALSKEEITVDHVLRVYDAMQTPTLPPGMTPESHSAADFDLQVLQPSASSEKSNSNSQDVLVIDRNLKGIEYKLAGCCHPIYGDDVLGFVSIVRGITIHRADCPNIRNLMEQYPYRIQRARWSGKSGSQYSITLSVLGIDDIGIVSNISSVINKEQDTLLRSISIDTEGGLFRGHLTVMVNDLSSLNVLMKKIKAVKGVKNVTRTN